MSGITVSLAPWASNWRSMRSVGVTISSSGDPSPLPWIS